MKYLGPGMYGMDAPLWVSGATVPQWQSVTSPADGEVYRRITATGGGTTDPADDTTNYVAVSYERTADLLNGAVLAVSGITASNLAANAVVATLPAISTSVRTSIFSVSGRGKVDYLAFLKAAAGTTRVEVLVDGRTILDQTPTFTTTTVLLAIGTPIVNSIPAADVRVAVWDPAGVEFRRSLQVYITNTATASTTSAAIAYHLRSRA